MIKIVKGTPLVVHCRTGSLENAPRLDISLTIFIHSSLIGGIKYFY